MARLIYSMIMSLDGYVADEDGNFGWAAPDEEVHQPFNDMEREVGTYGRRMYETMVYWETAHTLADSSPVELDYAQVRQAADKVVYSRTLETVSSARTQIERDFDADTVRAMSTFMTVDVASPKPARGVVRPTSAMEERRSVGINARTSARTCP